MGMASSMSFGDDIDDALPLSARSRPGDYQLPPPWLVHLYINPLIYYPITPHPPAPSLLLISLYHSPFHQLSHSPPPLDPASIERDSRSHPDKAEAKDGDISPLNDDKQQQHQGDDEGKGDEGKGEGKDDEHKSADEQTKQEGERKLVAPIDSFFVSHN